MDDAKINAIVEAVVKELLAAKAQQQMPVREPVLVVNTPAPVQAVPAYVPPPAPVIAPPAPAAAPQSSNGRSLVIDLPDPTVPEYRYKAGVKNPAKPDSLDALVASTTARSQLRALSPCGGSSCPKATCRSL